MQNQVYVFIAFILNGIIIGIIFDVFRILRKSFKTPDMITYIEDITFGILSGLLILFSIMKFNNGDIRVFLFLGIIIGLSLYLLLFSNIFIKVSLVIINFVKKFVNIIIIIPIKFIYKIIKKIILKPVILICVNIRKIIKKVKLPRIKISTKIYKKNKK